MAYQYENVKLEKGMYGQSGKSFLKVLESLDPSENYKGTALEGLDAFQRQLKRFDIHVKGAGSDMVEKFFHTSESSVLFPEFVSRVVRQGMESDILPDITATVTNFDGMDYRSIASVPTDDDKELKRVEEGAGIPTTSIRTQENLVKLHKRGRMLVASYEAIRFQRLDLFSVTLRQIGAYIARMHLKDAIDVLMNGDGNNNAATSYTIGDDGIGGTKGTLSYDALLGFWSQFDPLYDEHDADGQRHDARDAQALGVPEPADGPQLPGHGHARDPAGCEAPAHERDARGQDHRP